MPPSCGVALPSIGGAQGPLPEPRFGSFVSLGLARSGGYLYGTGSHKSCACVSGWVLLGVTLWDGIPLSASAPVLQEKPACVCAWVALLVVRRLFVWQPAGGGEL